MSLSRPPSLRALLSLHHAVSDLGLVERATVHPDGVTPESDTTHTVALALIVAEVGACDPALDVGLAVQLALVHDLPEAECGDTPTARTLTPEQEAAKDAREREGRARLLDRLERGKADRTAALLELYHRQDTNEARLVRVLDKVTPKLTAALSRGEQVRRHGMDHRELVEAHRVQLARLRAEYPNQPAALELLEQSMHLCEAAHLGRLVGGWAVVSDERALAPGCWTATTLLAGPQLAQDEAERRAARFREAGIACDVRRVELEPTTGRVYAALELP